MHMPCSVCKAYLTLVPGLRKIPWVWNGCPCRSAPSLPSDPSCWRCPIRNGYPHGSNAPFWAHYSTHSSRLQPRGLGSGFRVGRRWPTGRAEPGPRAFLEMAWELVVPKLRLPADAWRLPPTPAPGMFLSGLLHQGRPLGAADAPPPLRRRRGGGLVGRTPGFSLPPPILGRNSSEVPSGPGFPK